MTETVDTSQFIGMRSGRSTPERCAFMVLPVPYEKTTSYCKGTARGPEAIISASCQIEFWDEETKTETWKSGIYTLPPFGSKESPEKFFPRLEKKAESLLKHKNAVPFFLGGEHSISQALIPPFIKKYPGLSVLHFDAHADLRNEYEGSKHNHACALYPISRKCRVVQTGIRSVSHDEHHLTGRGNVKTFFMHEHPNVSGLIPKVLAALTGKVYLTIDMDGFDPSVIPGTGTPQPGGFTWLEGLRLFKAICLKKQVVGVDIVEISPQKNSVISEFAAAKLAYRLMGYLQLQK